MLYDGKTNLVNMAYNASFLDKLKFTSDNYLESTQDIHFVRTTLLSIGVPGTVVTLGLILYVCLRNQCKRYLEERTYRKRVREGTLGKYRSEFELRGMDMHKSDEADYDRPRGQVRSHREGTRNQFRLAPNAPPAPLPWPISRVDSRFDLYDRQ
jgi:hypothetical protein